MKIPYLKLETVHNGIKEELKTKFENVLEKEWFIQGEECTKFEEEFAKFCGGKYCIGVGNGLDAIRMILEAYEIGVGDEVIVPANTFIATVLAVSYVGATPVLVDADLESCNIDIAKIEEKITEKTKAIIVVHLYGRVVEMDAVNVLAQKYGLKVIEDSAQAHGAVYNGKCTGNLGNAAAFSFYPGKNLYAFGEGGSVPCHKKEYFDTITVMKNQGCAVRYYHDMIGYNYRMSNIVAGIGRGQMIHLEEHKALKKKIYEQYKAAFADIEEITMNPMNPDGDSNCWLSCITLAEGCKVTPNQIMDALEAENMESRPIWKPMHLQPVFEGYDFISAVDGEVSIGEDIFNRGLCLPSDIKNTKEDMEHIISIVRGCFDR